MAGMVPQDIYELTGVADPRLSPDGTTVEWFDRCLEECREGGRGLG